MHNYLTSLNLNSLTQSKADSSPKTEPRIKKRFQIPLKQPGHESHPPAYTSSTCASINKKLSQDAFSEYLTLSRNRDWVDEIFKKMEQAPHTLVRQPRETNIEFMDRIMEGAIVKMASDIHLEYQENNFLIRYRIDGQLRDAETVSTEKGDYLSARIKILAKMDLNTRHSPQDGRFHYKSWRETVECRVSILPTINGESLVLRLLYQNALFDSLSALGMSQELVLSLKRAYEEKEGMLLVAGPTGSGKTTSLYTLLTLLNSIKRKILTAEDPVEYLLPGAVQLSINYSTGLTFGNCIRSFLRQDPDIILVGEIRDSDTAAIAARAALTGHLLLSTLHTYDTAATVTRLLDLGLDPCLISTCLKGVLAQRLVRKNCPHCSIEQNSFITESIRNWLPKNIKKLRETSGQGCDHCSYTGFSGRTGIFEYLEMTTDLQNKINKGVSVQDIKNSAEKNGMTSLLKCGIELVIQGQTTIKEVERVLC